MLGLSTLYTDTCPFPTRLRTRRYIHVLALAVLSAVASLKFCTSRVHLPTRTGMAVRQQTDRY